MAAAHLFTSPTPWLRCVPSPSPRLAQVFDLRTSDQSRFRASRAMSASSWKYSGRVGGGSSAGHVPAAGDQSISVPPRPSSVAYNTELVNTVHLIGRVEDDVKVRRLAARQAVVNVCLAVHNRPGMSPREPPSRFDLLFWGPRATLAEQHLKKGDLVHVAGKVTADTYEAYLKRGTVRVFVLDLKFVQGDRGYEAAVAKSPFSRQSGSNTNHPQVGFKLHPKKACNFKFNNGRNFRD